MSNIIIKKDNRVVRTPSLSEAEKVSTNVYVLL